MATRAARSQRALNSLIPSADIPEETTKRIQFFYGKGNIDAVCNEALTLAGKLEQTQEHVQHLAVCQDALREKLEAVMAHEHYAVTITGVERNGSVVAEVAGLGNSRVQVGVHPDVDPEELLVGASALVSRERNCLLKVTAATSRWSDVATFEKYLDSPRPHLGPRPRDAGGRGRCPQPPRHALEEERPDWL